MLRAVQRGEFPPPRQLDPSIDRALEAVCLKAMALKPEDRYASPKALAEDVERWMADEPVTAWREPWTRTLLRWLTRHRTGVTAAAAAVLVGVVGLAAVLAVQARANAELTRLAARETSAKRPGRCQRRAGPLQSRVQARFDLAMEAIRTFHTGVSEDFLLKQHEFAGLRAKLLGGAAEFYRRMERLLQGLDDPRSRAALGEAYDELGQLTLRSAPSRSGSPCSIKGFQSARSWPTGRRPTRRRRRPWLAAFERLPAS